MKLVIQIPCLNERDHLEQTLADLPREVDGFDVIETLVVDDGSTDGTAERAIELGVHHVVQFAGNRGLSAAFTAGVEAALRLGADVIVNTDADNQYVGADIALLVAPVVAGRADVVVGDRQTDRVPGFSPVKRALQRWGSRLVRRASGTTVADATSGFRAISRRAALGVFVHNRFSYSLETIIQGGRSGLVFENVTIRTNGPSRPSRLVSSVSQYVRRNGPVILRAYGMYRPVQTFVTLGLLSFVAGAALVGRFLYFYVLDPSYSGHSQSLIVGVGCVIIAMLLGVVAMISDLMAANRRLLEQVLRHMRRLDAAIEAGRRERGEVLDGIVSTSAAPWRRNGDERP